MRIYHGSTIIIKKPELKKGRISNDYGQGFYCTKDIELAKEWACKDNENGYANIYDLDLTGLKVLDLTTDDHYVIEWISILIQHRTFDVKGQIAQIAKDYISSHFSININDYDVVIGYRADDSYFAYAQSFLNNTISLESLKMAMKLGNLGIQIALVSDKAIDHLKFVDYKSVDKEEYYEKYKNRDYKARSDFYEKVMKSSNAITGIFVMDILREEMDIDELRI